MRHLNPKLLPFLLVILVSSGCSNPFRKTKALPPAPTAIPARIPDKPIKTIPKAGKTNLPEPPALPSTLGTKPQVVASNTVPTAIPKTTKVKAQKPKPKRTAKAQPKRQPVPDTIVNEPAPEPVANAPAEIAIDSAPTVTPPEPAQPAFTLGAIVSPQERAALQKQTDELLSSCEQAISAASTKSLNGRQLELLARIRTFIAQAKEAKERNPSEAKNLAERGKLFADALSGELR